MLKKLVTFDESHKGHGQHKRMSAVLLIGYHCCKQGKVTGLWPALNHSAFIIGSRGEVE